MGDEGGNVTAIVGGASALSGPRVLVLATAFPSRVRATIVEVRRRFPNADIVLGAAEVDAWRFADSRVLIRPMGEDALRLDRPSLVVEIAAAFEFVVIPVGVPREGFATIPRFVRTADGPRFLVCGWLGLRLTSRLGAWLYLWLCTLVLHIPLRLLMRCARGLDGVGLLTLGWLAGRHRRAASERPIGGSEIVHVINNLGLGGAQRQVVEYLRRATVSGTPMRLLTLADYDECFRDEIEVLGIPVEVVHDRLCRGPLRRFLADLFPRIALVVALTARLREIKPCCVWSWLFLANVVVAPAARRAGVPRVLTSVRNMSEWKGWPEYRQWWFRAADHRAALLSDLVVVNARALAADYAAWARVGPERLRVVPNGIDAMRFLVAPWRDMRGELGVPPGVPLVLTVGRLAHEKSQDMLVRCAAHLRAAGVEHRLVIVGRGELEAELRQLAFELGVAETVVFAGTTIEPQSLYRSADVFVLSSRIEGMPNVLMEAQLFGLAAVTTRSGGSAEVVAAGRTGFVVEVGDEPGFAAALRRLLEDRELRRRMGDAARTRMVSEFGLEHTVAAMDALVAEGLPERLP